MVVHILGKNNPECPLCEKKFEMKQLPSGRNFYVCKPCEVAIDVKDPMVGRWKENFDPDGEQTIHIPCPNPKCRTKMRMFCRSDQYMKAVCPNPKCGAVVETEEMPDGEYIVRKGKGDGGLIDSET